MVALSMAAMSSWCWLAVLVMMMIAFIIITLGEIM